MCASVRASSDFGCSLKKRADEVQFCFSARLKPLATQLHPIPVVRFHHRAVWETKEQSRAGTGGERQSGGKLARITNGGAKCCSSAFISIRAGSKTGQNSSSTSLGNLISLPPSLLLSPPEFCGPPLSSAGPCLQAPSHTEHPQEGDN